MKKVISLLKLPEAADEAMVVAAVEKLQAGETKVGLVVDKLLAIGRTLGTITDSNEPAMKKLAGTDLNLFLDLFQVNAPANPAQPGVDPKEQVRLSEVIAQLNVNLSKNPAAKSDKDRFAEAEKKGPQALAAWNTENAADYTKCFTAYWGEAPK
jgi:hypothetical protein